MRVTSLRGLEPTCFFTTIDGFAEDLISRNGVSFDELLLRFFFGAIQQRAPLAAIVSAHRETGRTSRVGRNKAWRTFGAFALQIGQWIAYLLEWD